MVLELGSTMVDVGATSDVGGRSFMVIYSDEKWIPMSFYFVQHTPPN
jgi:hypothetical protein